MVRFYRDVLGFGIKEEEKQTLRNLSGRLGDAPIEAERFDLASDFYRLSECREKHLRSQTAG